VTETAAGTEANETRPGEASVSPGLFVTTSGGVLFCRSGTGAIDSIVESGSRRWTGFFGIARHPRTGTIFAACRARLGTRRVRKHSTDVILYAIDPLTHAAEPVAEIPDVHDVHQIEVGADHLYLTDTGLNRDSRLGPRGGENRTDRRGGGGNGTISTTSTPCSSPRTTCWSG